MDTSKIAEYIETLRNLKETNPTEYLEKLKEFKQSLAEYTTEVAKLLEQIKK